MGLMKRFIRRDLAELHQDGVRISVIGERDQCRPGAAGPDRRGGASSRATIPALTLVDRLQLRLARRDRQGRAASSPRRSPPGACGREDITAEGAVRRARYRRHPRSRPARAHQRRDAAVELSAVAVRPTRSSFSSMPAGPSSAASCSRRLSPATARASAASAAAPSSPRREGQADVRQPRCVRD